MYPMVPRTNADMQCGASNSVAIPVPKAIAKCCTARCAGRARPEHAGTGHRGGNHALVPMPHALQTHSQDVLRLYHILLGLGNGNAVADVGGRYVPGYSVGGVRPDRTIVCIGIPIA